MFESRVDARPTRATRIGGGALSENRAEREDLGRDSAARGKAKGRRVGNKRIWRRDETMAGWYATMDRVGAENCSVFCKKAIMRASAIGCRVQNDIAGKLWAY
jgi:hypothetical protein